MRQPYPDYVDSGVAWLGKTPRHWEMMATKRRYQIQLGKMLQPQPSSESDEEIPYLKAQHVRWRQVLTEDLPLMWADALDKQTYGVKLRDLLVCEGGEGGRAAIVTQPIGECIIQNALHRVRPTSDAAIEFLSYWLIAFSDSGWLDAINNKATIAHFTREKFASMPVSLPPGSEQGVIVAYLDRETSRIDDLISKQESLIERLDEYRTALITRVVTNGLPPEAAEEAGLDPAPKLKDTGVDWLGEVPEHWAVDHLRRCVKWIKTGSTPTSAELHESVGDDIAWFSPGDVGSTLQMKRPSRALAHRAVVEGVVPLFPAGSTVIVGIGATTGRIGHIEEPSTGNQQLTCIVGNDRVFPRFVSWQLWAYTNVMRSIAPCSTLPILNNEFLLSLPLAVPSLIEQRAIVEHLDAASHRIDVLRAKAELSIERLSEYRSALISAAVTGKIDVRGRESSVAGGG